MQPNLTDASLIKTGALPNGATTANTASVDTQNSVAADSAQVMEWEIDAPALSTGQLADAATMSYAVIMSAASNLGTPTLIYDNVIVQTGAGGAGAAAKTARFRLPFQPGGQNATLRYLGIRATNSGAGNASAATMQLVPRF